MKKLTKGFTLVELLVVIGILGILMGALFPAISAALLSANTSAMSMRGRNLFVAITQCNTDREGAGLQAVWPQSDTEGLDDDDTQLIGAGSTTEFFQYLFDMQNYGQATWKPYADVDLGVLSGSGVPGMSGGTLKADNIGWVVVQNIQSEIADVIPAFVSRNCDYTTLGGSLASFDGSSTTEVKCGNGKYTTPFGDKAWIIIRKGGAAQTIKAKYSKLSVIFNRQGFDNSNLKHPLAFLELN